MDWIMCIPIELSNVFRKKSISPKYKGVMRTTLHLLEDTIKDTVHKRTYESDNPLSIGLYRQFKEIVENDAII